MVLENFRLQAEPKHAAIGILRSDDKKRARLNTIAHLLSLIPYKKVSRKKITLPPRSTKRGYDDDASIAKRRFVKERY